MVLLAPEWLGMVEGDGNEVEMGGLLNCVWVRS